MRLQVHFVDRVGIAQEILAVLAGRSLDVVAVEVDPPYIYLEAPALQRGGYVEVRAALSAVKGVRRVSEVAMLPGARHRLYLDAVLASLADPVLAVDDHGTVVVANPAAVEASGMSEEQLVGLSLQQLTGDAQLAADEPRDLDDVLDARRAARDGRTAVAARIRCGGRVGGGRRRRRVL